jgi:hypothetical protein
MRFAAIAIAANGGSWAGQVEWPLLTVRRRLLFVSSHRLVDRHEPQRDRRRTRVGRGVHQGIAACCAQPVHGRSLDRRISGGSTEVRGVQTIIPGGRGNRNF